MPLSSRLIKSIQADANDNNDWVIDTAYEIKEEPDDYLEDNAEAQNEIAYAKKKVSS